MSKVILVVSMGGYPKHGLHDRIDELFDGMEPMQAWQYEGHGRHQYFYNSGGAQLMYFTNYSIPEGTGQIDVWSEIWDMDWGFAGVENDGPEYLLPEPKPFEINGQQYLYIGDLHGYHHDSTDPADERYEP